MIGEKLKQLRRKNGLSQKQLSDYMKQQGMPVEQAAISRWEKDQTSMSVEQFFVLCRLYSIRDVLAEFDVQDTGSVNRLNALGQKRVKEYIELLEKDERFCVPQSIPVRKTRFLPLYDISVSAGRGLFLDSDHYEQIEVDTTVPEEADYAVKISGDSMMPRFADGQIIYVCQQITLEDGEIGIFVLNGDVFCKMLDIGKSVRLLSLNPRYEPIRIAAEDTFRVLGKVVK